MRSVVVGAVVLAVGVTGGAAGSVGSVPADRAEKPIAGTSCSEFPADNWWHADVSDLPVHRRSRQWLSHMSTGSDLHPDFGPSYGDGPELRHPDHRRRVRAPQGAGALRVRRRERQGALPARQGHPDRGRPPLRPATGTRSSSTRAVPALRDLRDPGAQRQVAAPAPARCGRCAATRCGPTAGPPPTRPACRSSPGLLRWNEVRDGRIDHAIRFTTDVTSRHHLWPARHDAGSHEQPGLPADGRPVPAEGVVLRRAACRRRRGRGPGDEEVRPGAGRQRLAVVLPGRAERATGRTG